MKKAQAKKVYVGVSGGVDSSVAAGLLHQQGYDVVGVFIRTWQPDWIKCTWRTERRDAMRVCAHLGIPFKELDLSAEYKRDVADYMISEYRSGRTPNPDVMCNRAVKFGGFWSWAQQEGADFIATGHYAQVKKIDEKYHLIRGNDNTKDQSYFLWMLNDNDLEHVLFPVGNLPKLQVRQLAEKFELSTATKKDSQGICFLGQINMKEFLQHYIDVTPGGVLNEYGEVIGHHDGALFYTIGERRGFTITAKTTTGRPYYVVDKDVSANTITVSHQHQIKQGQKRQVDLILVNDYLGKLQPGQIFTAQIRYRGELQFVKILEKTDQGVISEFADYDPTLTPGQSVVFYNGQTCLGGGIVN